ncbi:MAG: major capsid protein, partial [Cyanobacteriota bacterium]
MGLTLLEAAKYEKRVERLAVLKTFSEGELLRRLPFRNLIGGSLSFPAEVKLPRVGFRAVNEGYRQSYGVIHNDSEFVHLFGGDLDVDRSIVDLQGPEARAAQTEMKVRSMRLTLEAAIIKGDDTFDPRAF